MSNVGAFVPGNRRGVAIVIALFFSFCLMVLFVSMLYRQSNTAAHNQLSIQEKQSYFAARAAMQHFLVKAKLFPTELYDAVEFKQGKNPLCNFVEFEGTDHKGRNVFEPMKEDPKVYVRVYPQRELDADRKAKYFYLPVPGKDAFIRLGSYYNPDYRFLAPGLAVSDLDDRYLRPQTPTPDLKADKFLKFFVRDCTNMEKDGGHLQPALEMTAPGKINKIKDFDISVEDGYPYSMSYQVLDVNIQSIKGLRKYGEEAIEVLVEGYAKDFKGKVTKQVQKKVQKITRKGVM
jgi:hypothetical protein